MGKKLPLRKQWILPWQRLPLWIHTTKYQYTRQTFQFQIGLWLPIYIFNFLPDLYKVRNTVGHIYMAQITNTEIYPFISHYMNHFVQSLDVAPREATEQIQFQHR